MKTVAVVLAAGSSRRLGTPKQLLDYKGQPLVRHAALVALGAKCDETVVIGPYADVLRDLPLTILDNPAADEGVSSSVRLAVQHAAGARILFTLCDQPLVTTDHLRALIAEDAAIVATAYAGVVGVPAIFAPQLAPELLALRGDAGARAVIGKHQPRVIRFEDAAIDIDTLEDYRKL